MNKKAKVLLITPNLKGIGDGVNRIQPSLGLLLIAPILEKNGHEVKIYDSALDGWENRTTIDEKNNLVMIGQTDDKIGKVISDFSPDIVAVSVLFSNLLESAHNIAKITKKVKKDTIVILGGNHISSAVSDYKIGQLDKNSGLPDYIRDLERLVQPAFNPPLVVTPIIVTIDYDEIYSRLTPNEDECNAIFLAPLMMFLQSSRKHSICDLKHSSGLYRMHHFMVQDNHTIFDVWGMTADVCIYVASVVYKQRPNFAMNEVEDNQNIYPPSLLFSKQKNKSNL